MKMLLAALSCLSLALAGCIATVQQWDDGGKVITGTGGAKTYIDGVEVWTEGTPPRKYSILFILNDERPAVLFYTASLKNDIARAVRQHGGDAAILLREPTQAPGHCQTGAVALDHGNVYGSGSPFAPGVQSSKVAIIKYAK